MNFEQFGDFGIRVLCGSEDDVLDRYYQAARLLNLKRTTLIEKLKRLERGSSPAL